MYYKKNNLFIEKIRTQSITKKVSTPFYCYSYNQLKTNILSFKKNFSNINPLICFSVKSNNNLQILKVIKNFGLGADVVSKGELLRVLKAGINPNKIVFSGVGKTTSEIDFAIQKKILLINAESENELKNIQKIAKKKNKIVNVGLRLNPNIDARTLKKISTGRDEDKFGISKKILIKLINNYKNSSHINIKCLSVHIGSQILDHRPYLKMINVLNNLIIESQHKFDYIDLGGGMGIDYNLSSKKLNYKKYKFAVKKLLNKHKVKIIFEPGRSIIGDTAALITKVIYIKSTSRKNFVIMDAAMNDFMRPALYGSFHRIIPAKKSKIIKKKIHDFVGPICETTDRFLSLKKYQKIKENDILAICDVGAYGIVLASNYNLRTKPSEVLVKNSNFKIISKKENISKLV
tara:strand:+ start:407 stop:1621 length:1215 start_codon:yes stop_codon:yes gene_type:complete